MKIYISTGSKSFTNCYRLMSDSFVRIFYYFNMQNIMIITIIFIDEINGLRYKKISMKVNWQCNFTKAEQLYKFTQDTVPELY